MNSVFSFNKYKKYIFLVFGCRFVPEKFSFCPKNDGFARVWGLQPPEPPGSYACADKNVVKLSVRSAGREFQIVGAAWQNARLPKTVVAPAS